MLIAVVALRNMSAPQVEDQGTDEVLALRRSHSGNKLSPAQTCMKCAKKAVCVARVKDPFCRECFLSYFMHRFRSTLGKAKCVDQEEKVLLAYSGGLNSSAMLRIVQEGLTDTTHKKLRFNPSVIIVDEGIVHGHTPEERLRLLAERLLVAMEMGYPTYFTGLEEVFGSCRIWRAEDVLGIESDCSSHPPKLPTLKAAGEDMLTETACNVDDNQLSSVLYSEAQQENSTMKEGVEVEEEEEEEEAPSPSDEEADPLSVCFADDDIPIRVRQHQTYHSHAVHSVLSRDLPLKFTKDDVVTLLSRLQRDVDGEKRLDQLFKSLTTLTAQEDMLRTLRNQLLTRVAQKSSFTKVMLADNETRLAVRLLSCVSQGRGGTVPLDVGYSDTRYGSVVILKPMREFPSEEIAFYCNALKLDTISYPVLGSLAPKNASIEKMTEDFVTGLQGDFPNTINIVFRTGDKISVGRSLSKCEVCALCSSPLESDSSKHVAMEMKQSLLPASDDSGVTPLKRKVERPSGAEGGCECEGGCQQKDCGEDTLRLPLLSALCYGCQLSVSDLREPDALHRSLPHFVVTAAQKQVQRSDMREHIKDYLLTDEPDSP